MTKKMMMKQLKRIGIAYVVVVLLAVLSMTAVYVIPTGQMQGHVWSALDRYVAEGDYPSVLEESIGRLDNYSEAIMVSTALTKTDNPWRDTFAGASYKCKKDGDRPVEALIEQVSGAGSEKIKLREYARYWHGYVVWLKPMLYFFPLQELKLLLQVGLGMLMGVIFALLWKKAGGKLAVSFGISMFLVCVQVVPYSLQYVNMFSLTFLSMLVLLLAEKGLKKKDALYLFFWIVGMCTGFFDLLTTPMLVVGMLLIVSVILDGADKAKDAFGKVFWQGLCFCAGYVAMWATKWLLGSMVLGKNILADAAGKVADRTSGEALGLSVGVPEVAERLIGLYTQPFMKKMLLLAVLFAAWVVLVACVRGRRKQILYRVGKYAVLLCVSMIPVVWLLALRNHTFIHYWFTYRNLAVLFWGILSYIALLTGPFEKETKRGE